MLEMVRIGLWATLTLKLRRTFATLSENPLIGVEQDKKSTLVGIIHFLWSVKSTDIVNEVDRVVISGEGFRYSLSPL